MSDVRICGVSEVPSFIEEFKIKKLLSCLSNYRIVDMAYGFTESVLSLNPTYWKDTNNWLRLNMEDTTRSEEANAPTIEEVIKGISFGSSAIKAGNNLLVHCQLGISRSPAIAIGSMIMSGDSIETAYEKAKQVRPKMDPNPLIILIIDNYLKLNGKLTEYNDQHRSGAFKVLKEEYNKLMEANMNDPAILHTIFEHISSLDRL